MEIKYTLFGMLRTTHEMANDYLVIIMSEQRSFEEVLEGLYETRFEAATYWGARFKAWRLARLYASLDRRIQAIWVLKKKGCGYFMKWQGEIPVRTVVGFFTRSF